MLRNYRKPLIMAAPKIGLKHPKAISPIDEFAPGTTFKPIYANDFGNSKEIKKVIICSGKVYLDIEAKLAGQEKPDAKGGKSAKLHGIKVIRCEELAPFPIKQIE